jgi:hypothetical protein
MSPRRGDRVTVPPPRDQWDVRFGTSDAVDGWDELCRYALSNTRRCLEILRADPRSGAVPDRQHRLRGDLATHQHNGRDMEQWEYEVTSGGRVRYVIDDDKRTVWLIYPCTGCPRPRGDAWRNCENAQGRAHSAAPAASASLHSPSTRWRPRSTSFISDVGRWPTGSSRPVLSRVTRAVTFTTESFGRPDEVAASGAGHHVRRGTGL